MKKLNSCQWPAASASGAVAEKVTVRRLVISENHTLEQDGHRHSADNDFEMYCWTRQDLIDVLRAAGFVALRLFGAYDASVEPGTTDRLVVVGIAGSE